MLIIMKKIVNRLVILVIFCCFFREAFAFDPLLTESNIPSANYNFYNDEKKIIEKTCYNFVPEEEITIFRAINMALCNNPSTKLSWLTIKKQAAIYGITKSTYLPTATINSEKVNNKTNIQLNGETKKSYFSNQIALNWLLYDFGGREAKLERDYFLLIQVAQSHNRNLQQKIYDIIVAYSNLSAAQETLTASLKSEESNKLAFNLTNEKFNVGLAPKADVLKIESNYSQAILNRQKAENSVAIYLGNFLQLLALPQGTKIKLISPSFKENTEFADDNISDLINKALQDRPDLKSMLAKEKSQKADYDASKRGRFPKINLTANQSYDEIKNDYNQRSSYAGISLNYNFFTGFEQTYLINQSKYYYESTKEERRQLENQIAFDVWSAVENLKTAKATEVTAQTLLNSSSLSREVTFGMYKIGKGSIVDVITAEASFANAMKELVIAKYNKFSAEAALLLSIGDFGKVFGENIVDN
jgi:outer membrane protein